MRQVWSKYNILRNSFAKDKATRMPVLTVISESTTSIFSASRDRSVPNVDMGCMMSVQGCAGAAEKGIFALSQTRELVLPKTPVLARRLRLVAKVPKGPPSLGSGGQPLLPVCTLTL